jgi:uncharacterized protein (DUF1697 family)
VVAPTPQIAFLRAVNLGPSRRLEMAALRDALADAGYAGARTFLQSGNVLVTSELAPAKLGEDIARQIAGKLGLDVQVIVRTREELAQVVERNPLGEVATNPSRYQVNFLSAAPAADVVRELKEADVAPEQLRVIGREIYAWHPDGVHRSRALRLLTERRLGVVPTARNWNTVVKLLGMAGE